MTDDLRGDEDRAYGAFREAVAAVPRERMEEALLPDGWTVKDVLWHVAYWWRDGASTFGRIAAGSGVADDAEDEDTDVTNARVLDESRSRSLHEVEDEVTAARAVLLEAYAPVAGTAAADELFRSETIDHYDEHIEAVRSLGA